MTAAPQQARPSRAALPRRGKFASGRLTCPHSTVVEAVSRSGLAMAALCGVNRGNVPALKGTTQRETTRGRMYTLYSMQRSGNCYKVRLALAQLRQPYRLVEIDILT